MKPAGVNGSGRSSFRSFSPAASMMCHSRLTGPFSPWNETTNRTDFPSGDTACACADRSAARSSTPNGCFSAADALPNAARTTAGARTRANRIGRLTGDGAHMHSSYAGLKPFRCWPHLHVFRPACACLDQTHARPDFSYRPPTLRLESPMRNRHFVAIALACTLFVAAAVVTVARLAPPPAALPGSLGDGVTLLPNGWKIKPAGRHMPVGDLPLAMVESPDGNYLVVTNNGYAKPTLTIVDLERGYVGVEDPRRPRVARPRLASRTAAASSRRAPARRRSTSSTGRRASSRPAPSTRSAATRRSRCPASTGPSRSSRASSAASPSRPTAATSTRSTSSARR